VALAYDPMVAVATLSAADPKLGRLMALVGPPQLARDLSRSVFGSLASAIVHQQLTGQVAATILGRLDALAGPRRALRPAHVLAASDAALRAVGLSGSKARAMRDLAEKTLDGTVGTWARLDRLDDEAVIERLTQVRGVGRWTAEMLLIFRLGRPDVLPVDDYGVRKGLRYTHGLAELPSKAELLEMGERWRPYRSVASWYLWRAAEREMAELRAGNNLGDSRRPATRDVRAPRKPRAPARPRARGSRPKP
jgi:3-methyladenine DNA glycosylase/8-oxoguanine DNA glycosylase